MAMTAADTAGSDSFADTLASGFNGENAVRVLSRTAGFAALGGLSGSSIALLKLAPAIPAAFQSALSTGGTAFAFFSLREYLVCPSIAYIYALQGARRSTSLHLRNLPESSIAGFLTGASLGLYYFRKPARALSGGLTFGAFACMGQLAFNEVNVLRIRYITSRTHLADIDDADSSKYSAGLAKPSLLQRATETVLSVTPVRKISNDEYLATLQSKVKHGEQELHITRGQIRDVEMRLAVLQREASGTAK